MPAQKIRAILRDSLPELREKYGVTAIGVFDSCARGEATLKSNIDIIVELGQPIGWKLVDLTDYLEARLNHTVHLVIKRSLHPLIRDQILSVVQYT